jgi:hypothetical protein
VRFRIVGLKPRVFAPGVFVVTGLLAVTLLPRFRDNPATWEWLQDIQCNDMTVVQFPNLRWKTSAIGLWSGFTTATTRVPSGASV